MADNSVIKPTASAPAIDTSNWPLLLKVCHLQSAQNKIAQLTSFIYFRTTIN